MLYGLGVGIISVVLFGAVAVGPAMANDVFSIGSNTYSANGQTQTMDAVPYIENGRTMLPVRYVAEALGIPDSNIKYNQSAQTVTIIDVGSSNGAVQLTVGSDIMLVVGGQIAMDTPPEITNGRVFLPIKWIAQGLGANISWNPDNQQVTIGSGGGQGSTQPAPITVTSQVYAPTITPDGGTFSSPQTVTIGNIPSGDTCYYTTDGSSPETSSSAVVYIVNTSVLTVSQSEAVSVATQDQYGNWSGVALAYFTISTPAIATSPTTATPLPEPTITPDGGIFTGPVTVTISNPGIDGGGTIYTTDGSNPETSSSATCTSPFGETFTINQSETVQAAYCVGVTGGNVWSNVISANFVINSTPVPEPTIIPDGGIFTGPVQVIFGNSDGELVFYTTDGSNPETSSSAIAIEEGVVCCEVSKSEVVRAACRTYAVWGNVASAKFVIKPQPTNMGPSYWAR